MVDWLCTWHCDIGYVSSWQGKAGKTQACFWLSFYDNAIANEFFLWCFANWCDFVDIANTTVATIITSALTSYFTCGFCLARLASHCTISSSAEVWTNRLPTSSKCTSWQCETSSGSHHRGIFSIDQCCRRRSKPGCLQHTKDEMLPCQRILSFNFI